jgi:flagellar biogenesis protein FliO
VISEETIAFQSAPIITFGYVMQVFISLLVVLALIYVIAKYIMPRMKTSPSGRLIKVLEHIYLEPQVSAYILSVAKASWLVVVSNKQVTKIDKVEIE